jgi:hypothetical protein
MKKQRGAHRPRLPERPFLIGTWTFPFSPGVRGRTLLLAVLAFMVGVCARESLRLMASGDGRLSFLGAMFTVLTVFAMVIWFAVAGACALAVVADTANGCDRIVRWPTAVFLDWIGETFVVATAVGISVAPLVGLAWMSRQSGSTSDGGVPLGFFFLFPVVFLSLLENGALFDVVSLPTLRTFWVAPGGWGRFYLSTAILVLAAASIVVLAIPAGGDGQLWGITAIAVVSVMSSLVWLIYFRLLGRLAWFCADRTTAAEDEAELKAEREAERNAEPDDED